MWSIEARVVSFTSILTVLLRRLILTLLISSVNGALYSTGGPSTGVPLSTGIDHPRACNLLARDSCTFVPSATRIVGDDTTRPRLLDSTKSEANPTRYLVRFEVEAKSTNCILRGLSDAPECCFCVPLPPTPGCADKSNESICREKSRETVMMKISIKTCSSGTSYCSTSRTTRSLSSRVPIMVTPCIVSKNNWFWRRWILGTAISW